MEHRLDLQEQKHGEQVRIEQTNRTAELNARQIRVEEDLAHLRVLKDNMAVDVSRYVLSSNARPAKIVRIVGDQANFHLHQSS